jgi:hypothetical protein
VPKQPPPKPHIADERECIEKDVFRRDPAEREREGESPPVTEAAQALIDAERTIAAQALELRTREILIEQMMKQITRLTQEAIVPVCALNEGGESRDQVIVMSDGSLYEIRYGDAGIIWKEYGSPIPRTRAALQREWERRREIQEARLQ